LNVSLLINHRFSNHKITPSNVNYEATFDVGPFRAVLRGVDVQQNTKGRDWFWMQSDGPDWRGYYFPMYCDQLLKCLPHYYDGAVAGLFEFAGNGRAYGLRLLEADSQCVNQQQSA